MHCFRVLAVMSACCAWVGTGWAGAPLTLYVSPAGNDAWSDRLERADARRSDGPLATLPGARDTLRRLKKTAPLTAPVQILIAAGTYPLSEPVVFTPDDAGTAACPITYRPHHRAGITRASFDVRMEPGAVLFHEWRDSRQPYHVGPTLTLRDGKLFVAGEGRPRLATPHGQWLHFEIAAPLGPLASGKWDLLVALPAQTPQKLSGLPHRHAAWKTLDWLGSCSMASAPTTFYLDNLHIGNTP